MKKFNGVDLRTEEWRRKPEEMLRVKKAVEGLHEDFAGAFNELSYLILLGQLEGTDPELTYESLGRLLRPYVQFAERIGVIWPCEVTPL
jgi:hypothetical protein